MTLSSNRESGALWGRALTTGWRRPWRNLVKKTSTILFCAILAIPASAAQRRNTIIVKNDPGGSISQRVAQIQQIRRSGQRVEIRSGYCMSACTMYLDLSNMCVSRNVTFGFHGPSSKYYGVALPPAEFERWSRVMANHYPQPLRNWYMQTGRNITVGFYKMSGRDLIRMGIPECA